MKRILILSIFFLLIYNTAFTKKKSNKLVIKTAYTCVYQKPSYFSKVRGVLEENSKIIILSQSKNWLKIKHGSLTGYVHKKTVAKRLVAVNKNIWRILTEKKKDKQLAATKKGFSEEDELSAASKGFSEEDELSAAAKGFSEEDELSAASKGFSEEDELSAASKGFNKKKKKSRLKKKRKKLDKKDVIQVIFSKYYTFNKKQYLKRQKKMLNVVKKLKVKKKKIKRRNRKKRRKR